jgi:hypothetical protein
MSNIWYLAQGESSLGPMTLPELVSKISTAPSPEDASVWRPGFSDWQKAPSVREIADCLFIPPPLTGRVPKEINARLTAQRTEEKTRDDLKGVQWSPGEKSTLKGIGGWLILFAIGQVVGPLKSLVSFLEYLQTIDRSMIERFPVTFIGEGLINVFFLLFVFWTAVAFFRTSKWFPRMFAWEVLLSVLLLPIDALWVATTLSMASGQSMSAILKEVLKEPELAQSIAMAIGGGLWVSYLFKSKRVANTFVN